ncbi:hypothetical protein BKK52_10700 [Rodentibacter trehalosifermentans]|uniref:Uncharacterized protein n=1 Tax=Rodentibacter trehalosifermentans TaxID=1908263 RepID=A0A1V3IXI1_9PAST|nr:hypothetical protein [Rodentibacter trehalosifermentans]OOF46829.1 hypothetical protein BKK52_10700 [Rodentibacter trehalosifermentans]
MSYLKKLFEISSNSIGNPNEFNIPVLLEKLYSEKNGFWAFEGAFRVFPISVVFSRNLYSWNEFLVKEINLKEMFFC